MTEEKLPQDERRLSAIMFSDIVGYSKKMQEDEDLALELLSRHNVIVRGVIKKYGGSEIKVMGDAFLVDFATVANAVRCAIEIQETISKYNEDKPENQRILLRIGIHVGDIIIKENDVFGDGVNIASRIEPLAMPGGICISQEVYNMMKHKLDVEVVSLGPKELKNIKDKIEIYEILVGSIAGKDLATSGRRIVERGKPIHKKLTTWIVAGIILIGVAVGVYFVRFKTPEPSSQMISRVLRVPSLNANYPNISPDGNWVVYVAHDAKFIENVYLISASGGEPKKITNETVYKSHLSPCFSPDAGEIIYMQFDTTSFNIYKVPVLGGTSRRIISDGGFPVWSPDGKHIGFFRGDSLFIVNADGTEEKEVTRNADRFAWSPDSKEIALRRSFDSLTTGKYREIFIRNLTSGSEQQLTFDKKGIGDLCWTSTDEIIFNSKRGGSVNLWIMPATGGAPKQLTLGAGKDLFPHVSKDAKRLVYANESHPDNIWKADIETKQYSQLTFGDESCLYSTFSPDGRKIAYQAGFGGQIFICNNDGSEPTQITQDRDNEISPGANIRWSSDGNSIAYSFVKLDTVKGKPDSIQFKYFIFVHNLSTKVSKRIGEGALLDWSPDGKYMLYRSDSDSTWRKCFLAQAETLEHPLKQITTLQGASGEPSFSRDSKNVIYVDSVGLWIMPIERGKPKLLFRVQKGEQFENPQETPDGKSLMFLKRNDKIKVLKLLLLPKSSLKPGELIEIPPEADEDISISPDLKTIIFSKHQTANKIMLIDNFR